MNAQQYGGIEVEERASCRCTLLLWMKCIHPGLAGDETPSSEMTAPAKVLLTDVALTTRKTESSVVMVVGRGTLEHAAVASAAVGQHAFELRVVDRQGSWTTDSLVVMWTMAQPHEGVHVPSGIADGSWIEHFFVGPLQMRCSVVTDRSNGDTIIVDGVMNLSVSRLDRSLRRARAELDYWSRNKGHGRRTKLAPRRVVAP